MEVTTIERYLKDSNFQNRIKTMLNKQIIDDTDVESLHDLYDITDISKVEIYETYNMNRDGDTCTVVLFIDQGNNIRVVEIVEGLIFGMVEYYTLHPEIKKDLISSINASFHFEKYGC